MWKDYDVHRLIAKPHPDSSEIKIKKGIVQNSIVKKLIKKKWYGLQADEQVDTGLMAD